MIKFLIKKSFFGGWDNLIPQFLYNIACMALIALFLLVNNFSEEATLVSFLPVIAIFLLLYCILNFGIAGITHNWTEYQSSWGQGFGEAIVHHIPHILVFYLIALFCAAELIILIPFYMNMVTFLGAFVGFIQIWIVVFLAIAMQYYIPLCLFLDKENPFFVLKQCFVLFFDNFGFTMFVSIKTVFDFLISALSFFFIPGLCFISLSHMDAVNLLHQRYRWAKENNTPKKNVNIYTMLTDERNNLGERTIRGMFRPWKSGK